MSEKMSTTGKATIAPEVLNTVARLTTLGIPGVSRFYKPKKNFWEIFKKPVHDGVRITVEDKKVYVDLYIVVFKDVSIRETGRQVQNQVARAISEMVGMEVGGINVHIEDVNYETMVDEIGSQK
ncbi:MAG TPA: Asp23/Gls24 family envelope stress response protein [Anaerolineaceae bacterium]|nr:Asp23/Gls24 family envelope stress response protein [Anaerolineaceae bacterium]HPN51663.1 Asp23/Gls24 family envelope stress response protein [Anaerolineaceae bacterium]